MAISILAQRNALATAYGAAAPSGALFTGSGPGTTGTAQNEHPNSGSPAYSRVTIGWGAAASSAITAVAPAFNVAAGQTITYAGVCVSTTHGAADVRDAVAVTSQAFASQGTYTVTFTYTQT